MARRTGRPVPRPPLACAEPPPAASSLRPRRMRETHLSTVTWASLSRWWRPVLTGTAARRVRSSPPPLLGQGRRTTREEQNHAGAHGRRHHLAGRLLVRGGLAGLVGDGRPRVLRLARRGRRRHAHLA